ncbi:TetR/AcrR family transcriptional regulator [Rhodococcus tukisamuensis]|uniref:DNA-binding transcriptional regulator, AcrR family n=1 Tax=Rhodococcus tukisamuensis TaxID=168276 RepID=A0A1G6SG40_9NOCA|nr:TetR/AcrR family transcriptional regulator [Rhodococcus tukisamuensis]SDD15828.1 DNA-binding transcriptional regulator, AcrR family [Rhodococcus tukisamuensis]
MTGHPPADPSAPHDRPGADAEQRLLDSARDAFAAKGYHGTSTREIAAGAGMSPAAMYIHFSSKQDVLLRLILAGHESALATLISGAATTGSATKRLRSAVFCFARWHAEQHTTGRVAQYELHALTEENQAQVVRIRRDTVRVMREIIADGALTGEFAVDNVDTATLAVMSLCIDTVRWFPSRELQTHDEVGAAFASIAERIVRSSD